jgi:hypothetical protein
MRTAPSRRNLQRFLRAFALVVALGACFASGLATAAGAVCTARSPAHRVALVELYSSEGCNSCPPADDWLSQWKNSGATQGIVPLALHVDYWNSLGWTDRFSQHRFTERQQTLTDLAGGHVLYTPEIFVAGRELRDWSRPDSFQSRIGKLVAEPAQAHIALQLTPQAKGAFDVDAQFASNAAQAAGSLNGYLAVYENSLTSHVGAGENSGVTLHHERVVRQWIGPVPLVGGNAQIRRVLRLGEADAGTKADASADAPAGRFGVVAFVENDATGDVLQVAELAACE